MGAGTSSHRDGACADPKQVMTWPALALVDQLIRRSAPPWGWGPCAATTADADWGGGHEVCLTPPGPHCVLLLGNLPPLRRCPLRARHCLHRCSPLLGWQLEKRESIQSIAGVHIKPGGPHSLGVMVVIKGETSEMGGGGVVGRGKCGSNGQAQDGAWANCCSY